MEEHGHSQQEIEARLARGPETSILRDVIYGAIDGSVTTFAIVAGVAGAGLSPFVIVALGFANVLADGFSMAVGNFSGTKAEADNARRLRAVEERHLVTDPDGERRELRQILSNMGLDGEVLEQATDAIARNRGAWIDLMMEREYGVGQLEPSPLRAALATFFAFLGAGLVPLLPFVLGLENAFRLSVGMTLAVFFAIGALKSHWSLAPWWRSGAETLAMGSAAAGIAYAVGTLFSM